MTEHEKLVEAICDQSNDHSIATKQWLTDMLTAISRAGFRICHGQPEAWLCEFNGKNGPVCGKFADVFRPIDGGIYTEPLYRSVEDK